jgi:signal transduction histidine kinase
LELLTGYVEHIKKIVATQQSYGKVSGVIENVSLQDLAEDTIRVVEPGIKRRGVRLERNYDAVPPVAIDKHSVFQILLNVLRNAVQAIDAAAKDEKWICVRIHRHGDNRVRLEVSDSGVGLTAENLTRIFAHGFTTRSDGHGFGLHSAALAAKQLGGGLWAESEGPGLGATFTLELPMVASTVNCDELAHQDARRPPDGRTSAPQIDSATGTVGNWPLPVVTGSGAACVPKGDVVNRMSA